MERKLVKQGRNALTVTLPAKWLQQQRLKAGDSVTLLEQDKALLITSETKAERSECTIDAQAMEQTMLYHALIGAYIRGYDRITIVDGNAAEVQEAVQRRLLGFIVEEHTPKRVVVKSIIAPSSESTQTLIRRAGHLMLQQAATLLDITHGKATIDDLKKGEDVLDSTLFFCMRHLNTYERGNDAYKYFLLCATIEIAADQLFMLAKHIGRSADIASGIHKALSEYNQHLFANDFPRAYKALRAWRNGIGTKTYAEGLTLALAETLYNNLGYLIERKNI